MDTALRHWLFHIECPHARRDWAQETSQMMHDHFFWGTVAVVVCAVLFVGLILWGLATGTPTAQPRYMPTTWPYLPMY